MKILGSFIAAAALAMSALVAVPTTANAAYPGTVATQSSYAAPVKVKKNRAYTVAYAVRSAGNARPSGVVSVRVFKFKNGAYRLIRVYSKAYTGTAIRVMSLGKYAKKGRYATRFAFTPSKGSVYKPSVSSVRLFRVKR